MPFVDIQPAPSSPLASERSSTYIASGVLLRDLSAEDLLCGRVTFFLVAIANFALAPRQHRYFQVSRSALFLERDNSRRKNRQRKLRHRNGARPIIVNSCAVNPVRFVRCTSREPHLITCLRSSVLPAFYRVKPNPLRRTAPPLQMHGRKLEDHRRVHEMPPSSTALWRPISSFGQGGSFSWVSWLETPWAKLWHSNAAAVGAAG